MVGDVYIYTIDEVVENRPGTHVPTKNTRRMNVDRETRVPSEGRECPARAPEVSEAAGPSVPARNASSSSLTGEQHTADEDQDCELGRLQHPVTIPESV